MAIDLAPIEKKIAARKSEWDRIRKKVAEEKNFLEEVQARLEAASQAQEIAQHAAQMIQQMAHEQIASVVSQCLEAVFDEPYNFKIIFDRKRGRTEARLVFERGGVEVDPLSASGGGVVDVAAFALRLSCLMLARPPLRRVLILDEPFKFLSAEYRDRARSLLEKLSADLKVQFIMVTHIDELKTGTILDLGAQE